MERSLYREVTVEGLPEMEVRYIGGPLFGMSLCRGILFAGGLPLGESSLSLYIKRVSYIAGPFYRRSPYTGTLSHRGSPM